MLAPLLVGLVVLVALFFIVREVRKARARRRSRERPAVLEGSTSHLR